MNTSDIRAWTTAFCLVCISVNWNYSSATEFENGSSSLHISGAAFIILFCIVFVYMFSRRLYRLVRDLLDKGISIPKKLKILRLDPCWSLFLMLIQVSSSRVTTTDGLSSSYQFGYGSDLSWIAALFAVCTVAVFQLHFSLLRYNSTEQGAAANP